MPHIVPPAGWLPDPAGSQTAAGLVMTRVMTRACGPPIVGRGQ
jgi:hypothetical protein